MSRGQRAEVTTETASSPARRNKTLVRRFFDDVLAHHDDQAVDELIAPGAVVSLPTGQFAGPEAVKRASAQIGSAFPDLRVDLHALVAEGDRVAAEWTLCGTEQREMDGVPPSGKWTCIAGLSLSRIEGGRIVEHRMIAG
ncbi:MAG: ester cyclase [Thermomicrobiales bacterium]|nr:ester cyclase [Thermomicrobiales bacterium]